VLPLLTPARMDIASTLQRFEGDEAYNWFIARTGYTGEDGLEIILPSDAVEQFWQDLLDAGVKPCGLAARDTLRLEAGMHLSGQDMDETTTPFESALSWTVAVEPEAREFIGREALLKQKAQGVPHKLVGIGLDGKGILRHGQTVTCENGTTGVITSGTYSPTLSRSIGFARVPRDATGDCRVEIRGKAIKAHFEKLNFFNKR